MPDELSYYRARLDELTGQVIRSDSIVSRSKRELGQRRKALAILSELQQKVRVDTPEADIARLALTSTSSALKMDRAVLLLNTAGPDAPPKLLAAQTIGYPRAEDPAAAGVSLELPALADARLVPAAAAEDTFVRALRDALKIPYFLAVPIRAGDRFVGLLVAGRLREQKPFYPPLDEGDLSTWQATAGFLGSALLNAELFRKTQALATSFARFVPGEFLDLLGKRSVLDVGLGDQRALEMTVLFSDIRGFTTVSEKLSPQGTFDFVNGYLAHAAPVIQAHGGFIDKYIGDAIMALFPGPPIGAVRAGIALRGAVEAFNLTSGLPPISVGVGIHTGPVILGTTGFQNRLDCTVIADAVNLASRLEGLTKYYGSPLILSGDALALIPEPDRPESRLVDRVTVKGKTAPVDLHDIFEADPEPTRTLKRQTRPLFESARHAYTTGNLPAARTALEQLLGTHSTDLAAKLLLKRVSDFETAGLLPNWQGIVALDAK